MLIDLSILIPLTLLNIISILIANIIINYINKFITSYSQTNNSNSLIHEFPSESNKTNDLTDKELIEEVRANYSDKKSIIKVTDILLTAAEHVAKVATDDKQSLDKINDMLLIVKERTKNTISNDKDIPKDEKDKLLTILTETFEVLSNIDNDSLNSILKSKSKNSKDNNIDENDVLVKTLDSLRK